MGHLRSSVLRRNKIIDCPLRSKRNLRSAAAVLDAYQGSISGDYFAYASQDDFSFVDCLDIGFLRARTRYVIASTPMHSRSQIPGSTN
jgi:hypothetical protein